jgi:3-oxoacyl-(acyl-carrier-protein) synthase
MRDARLVAITGAGAVSPYGNGLAALVKGLVDSVAALSPLTLFVTPLEYVPPVGEVRGPVESSVPDGLPMSRTDRLALMAAREAAVSLNEDAGLRERCAVVLASTVGGLSDLPPAMVADPAEYYARAGLGVASTYPVCHVSDSVAAAMGLGGACVGVSVACASGAIAIALAAQMIRDGRAPVALAGGSDALCTTTLAGFNALQALDSQPCRPFCETRAGLNIGEAAAAVLLEDLDHARARGAGVLGVLAGWAFNNDAHHSTAPDSEGVGLAACITQALAAAGVPSGMVGYVNAHGTGTPLNDAAEIHAYDRAFAGVPRRVPVSSTKGHIGHTLGAAGAIEAIVALAAVRHQLVFPTLRLARPIESVTVDLVRDQVRHQAIEVAISVSAGFGGSNACLVFEPVPDSGDSA